MKTQAQILQEMLALVPSGLDTRESSPLYSALAPVAATLSEMTFCIDDIINSTMADTATGELQTRLYREYGVIRRTATAATRKGIFEPTEVTMGSRFGAEGLSYVVVGINDDGSRQLQCETTGNAGNLYAGPLLPLDSNNLNLEHAELADVLVFGADAENDDQLRIRFVNEAQRPDHGWNKQGYRKEIRKITGVGDVAVFPTPEGKGGRIHCVIVDPNRMPASELLIATVQQLLDPAPQGEGNGLVPVGHTVSVGTVNILRIDIVATVAVQSGFTLETLQPLITEAISIYLQSLAFVDPTVRISRVENAILMVPGVMDIADTTINGQRVNITLPTTWENYQVPVIGSMRLKEMTANVSV